MLQIVLSRDAGPSKFRQVALFAGSIAGTGRAPFLSACRKLIEMGHDPAAIVECRWEGSNTVSFSGPLERFAKWTVKENETGGPVFTKWKPFGFETE